MGLIRWLADRVQESTGEKERRGLVNQAKALCVKFRTEVTSAISILNNKIYEFNQNIKSLNLARATEVKNSIDVIFNFLKKYGRCRLAGEYTEEAKKLPEKFPEKEQFRIEDYIQGVDWSSDEVFWNTFINTPLGMKFKTRKQNIALREEIGEIQLKLDRILQEISAKEDKTDLEKRICVQYLENINFINQIIQKKIIPELSTIDAFFEAVYLKDKLISGHEVESPSFVYRIKDLLGTPYEIHYRFIKNTFLFYILACYIYDTPVLTNLLNHKSTEDDIKEAEMEYKALEEGAKLIEKTQLDFVGSR